MVERHQLGEGCTILFLLTWCRFADYSTQQLAAKSEDSEEEEAANVKQGAKEAAAEQNPLHSIV